MFENSELESCGFESHFCQKNMKSNWYESKLKAYFSMKPAKKIFSLLGGKIRFELALQPSTASTAKIQIQFSRQAD